LGTAHDAGQDLARDLGGSQFTFTFQIPYSGIPKARS